MDSKYFLEYRIMYIKILLYHKNSKNTTKLVYQKNKKNGLLTELQK